MPRPLTFCLAILAFAFASGCASAPRSVSPISILSTPGHAQDSEHLRTALEEQHIHLAGSSNLGTFEISTPPKNATRGRNLIETIVHDEKLTLRVTKKENPLIYQVYEHGQKIREESYVMK